MNKEKIILTSLTLGAIVLGLQVILPNIKIAMPDAPSAMTANIEEIALPEPSPTEVDITEAEAIENTTEPSLSADTETLTTDEEDTTTETTLTTIEQEDTSDIQAISEEDSDQSITLATETDMQEDYQNTESPDVQQEPSPILKNSFLSQVTALIIDQISLLIH